MFKYPKNRFGYYLDFKDIQIAKFLGRDINLSWLVERRDRRGEGREASVLKVEKTRNTF